MKKWIAVWLLLSLLLCSACTPKQEQEASQNSKNPSLSPQESRDEGLFTDKIPIDEVGGKSIIQTGKELPALIDPSQSTQPGEIPLPEPVEPSTETK